MRQPTRLSPRTRATGVAAAVVAASLATAILPLTAHAAEVYPRPSDGRMGFVGRGFGHGIGMSQFGAEGMGLSGKTAAQILAFYYPGTNTARVGPRTRIRVHLSAAPTSVGGQPSVELAAKAGAFARVGSQPQVNLPTRVRGGSVTGYRVVRRGTGLALVAVSDSGRRTVVAAQGEPMVFGTAVAGTAGPRQVATSTVTVRHGSASSTYRGYLRVLRAGSGLAAVNILRLQQYVASVVGAEMPDGWTAAAYQAQAVAARSYALLLRQLSRQSGASWDICDTTCQSYPGVSSESAGPSAGVTATAGEYLRYHGRPVLAMFSSADGGYTVDGGWPYLVAHPDPYDGVVRGSANWGHSWTSTVTASTIQAHWPQIGRLKALVVLGRDGLGRWGGRVSSVRLRGTDAAVTVSADTLRWTLGLKSTWWRITTGAAS